MLTRPLKTSPMGASVPIFSAIRCKPEGVPSESWRLDGGFRLVDTEKVCRGQSFSMRSVFWPVIDTSNRRAEGLIFRASILCVYS